MDFIDIPAVKPWDPKEEMWDQILSSLPWIALGFASGVIAGFIYWILYVQIRKLFNFLIYGRRQKISNDIAMNEIG